MRWGLIGASTIAEQHMIGAIRTTGGEVAAGLDGMCLAKDGRGSSRTLSPAQDEGPS